MIPAEPNNCLLDNSPNDIIKSLELVCFNKDSDSTTITFSW